MAITRRRSFVVKPVVTERIPTRSISSLNLGNLQSELDNLSFKSDESSQSTKRKLGKLSEKFAKFSQKLKSLKKFQKKSSKSLASIEEPVAKKPRVNWVAPKEKCYRKQLKKQVSKPILRRKESLIEMNRGSIIVVWEEDLN